jgi:hypothetical protein
LKTYTFILALSFSIFAQNDYQIRLIGDTSIFAGRQTEIIILKIVDQQNIYQPIIKENVKWEILNGEVTDKIIKNNTDTLRIYAEKANRNISMKVTYIYNNLEYSKEFSIYVYPNVPFKIESVCFINIDSFSLGCSTYLNSNDSVIISGNDSIIIHCFFLDKFNNYFVNFTEISYEIDNLDGIEITPIENRYTVKINNNSIYQMIFFCSYNLLKDTLIIEKVDFTKTKQRMELINRKFVNDVKYFNLQGRNINLKLRSTDRPHPIPIQYWKRADGSFISKLVFH